MYYHKKKSINSKKVPSYRPRELIDMLPAAHPLVYHLLQISRYFPEARVLEYKIYDKNVTVAVEPKQIGLF